MASLQKEVTYPLTLIPDYLTFEDASNQIKTSVTLSNETNDRIAFRVRTNAPKGKFSVIPANGVIGANRKTVIDFTACKSIEELLTPAFAVEILSSKLNPKEPFYGQWPHSSQEFSQYLRAAGAKESTKKNKSLIPVFTGRAMKSPIASGQGGATQKHQHDMSTKAITPDQVEALDELQLEKSTEAITPDQTDAPEKHYQEISANGDMSTKGHVMTEHQLAPTKSGEEGGVDVDDDEVSHDVEADNNVDIQLSLDRVLEIVDEMGLTANAEVEISGQMKQSDPRVNLYNCDGQIAGHVIDAARGREAVDCNDKWIEPIFRMWKETILIILASFVVGIILGKLGF